MADVLDARGKSLEIGMYVKLPNGRPRHGKVIRVTPNEVDVQTERGVRTLRPGDLLRVRVQYKRGVITHADKLRILMANASRKPRERR